MHYVEFHVFHNNTTPSAPLSTLRNVLSKALEHFPENRHFQNLLLDIEAKSHIARRLRTYYNAQLKDNLERKCGTAIFAVISELERQKNLMDSVALATEMNIYGKLYFKFLKCVLQFLKHYWSDTCDRQEEFSHRRISLSYTHHLKKKGSMNH